MSTNTNMEATGSDIATNATPTKEISIKGIREETDSIIKNAKKEKIAKIEEKKRIDNECNRFELMDMKE